MSAAKRLAASDTSRWAKKFGEVRELRQVETPDVRALNKSRRWPSERRELSAGIVV